MDLRRIRDVYIDDGLDFQNATARTCRDVLLSLISASRMADHVTVKGGVVMQQISGDKRRATRDLDLDFVRYPMTDDRRFRKNLANARNNWLGANVDKVVSGILRHFEA